MTPTQTHFQCNRLAIIFVLILGIFLTACSQEAPTKNSTGLPSPVVDATFTEFYGRMGGFEILGPPISEINEVDRFKVQFTSASLMVHDPLAGPGGRFFLAPLGLELDVAEPPVPAPESEHGRYRDGHIVHEEFWGIYSRLQDFTGPPLTEGRYNPSKQRFEQYFANLGFYISDSDAERQVHMMDYGAFKCDRYCRYRSHPAAVPSLLGVVPEPFASTVSRLGSIFTGRALTDPYVSPDGLMEVIFDNLVLFTNPESTAHIGVRPIVELLDIQPHPLTTRIDDHRMDFYAIEGALGHNIPVIFTDFLAQHGSLDISGAPITEIYLYDQQDNIFRQCFTNLCLDYHHAPTQEQAFIRPAPLGLVYKAKFHSTEPSAEPGLRPVNNSLEIRVWEEKPLLPPGQGQTIMAGIFRGNLPLAGIVADVTVSFPDGTEKVYFFPETGDDGLTLLELSPIQARNGTLIPYEVCLQNVDNNRLCAGDEFVIWGN